MVQLTNIIGLVIRLGYYVTKAIGLVLLGAVFAFFAASPIALLWLLTV